MAAAGGSTGRTTESSMARPSKRRDYDDPCLCPRVAPLGRGAEINKPPLKESFSHGDVQQEGWEQFQVMTVSVLAERRRAEDVELQSAVI